MNVYYKMYSMSGYNYTEESKKSVKEDSSKELPINPEIIEENAKTFLDIDFSKVKLER